MCHQFGCRNVVATLGTSFTEGHAKLLRRYAKRIVLVFDSDIAGREAANRAMEVCLSQKIDIQLAFVTEGKDPCDYLLAAGADAFRHIIGTSGRGRRVSAVGGPGGPDLPVGSGRQRMDRQQAGQPDGHEGILCPRGNRPVVRPHGKERRLCPGQPARLSGYSRRCCPDSVRERIGLDPFTDPAYRPIAEVLWSRLREGREVTEAGLLTEIEDTASAAALVDLAEIGRAKQRFADRLDDAVKTLEVLDQAQQRRRIGATLTDEDTQQLRTISEMLSKTNVRNPGLLPR